MIAASTEPSRGDPSAADPGTVSELRDKLFSLGLERRATEALDAIADGPPGEASALAALTLAVHHMRAGRPAEAARRAGRMALAPGVDWRTATRLALVELMALQADGQGTAAARRFREVARSGLLTPDLLLARTGGTDRVGERLDWINRGLAGAGRGPLALLPGEAPAFDRLTARTVGAMATGPRVSVLVAAHDSAATLPAALRGLCAQSWRDLEIVVIDDASTDDTVAVARAAAARDERIRVVALDANVGAYAARNRGLAVATGTYVTLHDADDWSLPGKIAAQAQFLETHPEVIGCTSEMARLTPDLVARRLTGIDTVVNLNVSSFMMRRADVVERVGGWDEIRFGADIELIDRVRAVWGGAAVVKLATGPLSFLRDSPTSETANDVTGYAGSFSGSRKHYRELYRAHHARLAGPWCALGPRAFPVPPILLHGARDAEALRHEGELAVAADWRAPGAEALALLQGATVEAPAILVTLPAFDAPVAAMAPPERSVMAMLLSGRARMAVAGESVDSARLHVFGAEGWHDAAATLPALRAGEVVLHREDFAPDEDDMDGEASDDSPEAWGAASGIAYDRIHESGPEGQGRPKT